MNRMTDLAIHINQCYYIPDYDWKSQNPFAAYILVYGVADCWMGTFDWLIAEKYIQPDGTYFLKEEILTKSFRKALAQSVMCYGCKN